MRLLYLSSHAILEYDELKLFEELGIDYFSLGSYITPSKPADAIRPPLTHEPSDKLYHILPKDKDMLTLKFVRQFDIVVVMHIPEWISKNAKVFEKAGKRVIWRTIGQSTPKIERKLQPYRSWLQVVRYSPREQNIEDNIGADAVIRFYKDPDEFTGYTGIDKKVITFSQDMKHRAEFCNYDAFVTVTKGLPAKIYGPKNDNTGDLDGGFLTYEEVRQKMRDSRVYLYTGTQPASYTLNFIEAMMTGMPVVALGPKYANSLNIAGDTYEIPDIIVNGVNGFWSDSLKECRHYVESLIGNSRMSKRIGDMGRATAIEYFGKDLIKEQWRKFLYEYNKKIT